MYELHDTFNNQLISRHRTLRAAVRADIRHGRAVKRSNGPNSYIPTKIIDTEREPQAWDDPIDTLQEEIARLYEAEG